MGPRFYFSICQAGAEKVVKAEVVRAHPDLKPAFSRPGFITFKEESDRGPEIHHPESIFTRVWGVSVGQVRGGEPLAGLFDQIPEGSVVHAYEREEFMPGDEAENFVRNARINALIKEAGIGKKIQSRSPRADENVFDLIWIDEGNVFLGRHLHQEGMDPAPGNFPEIRLPEESPSRAYLKLEEAIHRFKPDTPKGAEVLEIGCSPGGATLAMLNRGFRVAGIDPKKMAPSIAKHQGFRFVQKMAKAVTAEDLSGMNPDWLVLDMNLAPLEALDEVGHVLSLLRKAKGRGLRLHSAFLTLKLNDWKFAESIPLYLRRISELGFGDLAAVQLCSNRQEFFVFARSFRA